MGITPSSIHKKTSLILPNSPSKCFRAFLENYISPTSLARHGCVNLLPSIIKEFWHDDLAFELGLSNLTFDAAA
jgi:hypothetical protein